MTTVSPERAGDAGAAPPPSSGAPTASVRSRWAVLAAPVVVALGSLAVFCVLVVAFTDLTPWSAVHDLWTGSFGSVDALSETLTRAVPLAFVAVGASIALRAGVFNVGGEGQMAMGAVAAALVVREIGGGPPIVVWVGALAVAGLGGAAWAVVPAALWAYRGTSEILSTLLVNFVTVSLLTWLLTHSFLHDKSPYVVTAQGQKLRSGLELPLLWSGSRLHAGVFIAVAVTLATAWWMRTPAGLRVDLVGANPALAAQAGLRPKGLRVQLLLASAAFAGLAGGVQLFGVSHRLTTGLTAGVGYTGVLVAVLGRSRPLYAAGAAVVFAALLTGGEELERAGAPRSLVDVVQALLVVGVALATRVNGRRAVA